METDMKKPALKEPGIFPLRIFGAILCGVLLLIAGSGILAGALRAPADNILVLEDWRYVSHSRLNKLETADVVWKTADHDTPIRLATGDSYIRLKGPLPPAVGGALYIRSANGGMTVRVDDKILCDTLEEDGGFVNCRTTILPLEVSGEARELDIVLYSPLAFSFTAAVGPEETRPAGLLSLPYADIVAAAVMIAAGVALAVIGWMRRRQASSPVTAGFLALALVLFGLSLLFNPLSWSLDATSSFPGLYRLSWFLRVLGSMLFPFSLFLDARVRTAAVEELAALNILYACYLLLWPYQMFFAAVIKLGAIVQIINAVAFVYGLFKWNRSVSPLACAVQTGFLLVGLLYWQAQVMQQNIDFTAALWTAAILCAAGTAIDALRPDPNRRLGAATCPGRGAGDKTGMTSGTAVSDVSETQALESVEDGGDSRLVYTRLDSRIDIGGLAVDIIREKCDGPNHHLLHVAEYVRIVALKMGLGEEKADAVADASLLHDIGKVCIPDSILFKTSPLTDTEFQEIRRHNQYGFHMLSGSPDAFVQMAARIAHEHHERIDGTGYLGLKRDDICLEAKIASVADVFDALTSPRIYKKTWSFEHAFSYIQEHSGVYFEPAVVQAFTDARDNLRAVYNLYQQNPALPPTADR